MNIKITSNNHSLVFNDSVIFHHDILEIEQFKIFDNNKIIVQLSSQGKNIICVDFKGNHLWTAEDLNDGKCIDSYDYFYIEENDIYCKASLMTTKIDPDTGKIIEKIPSK